MRLSILLCAASLMAGSLTSWAQKLDPKSLFKTPPAQYKPMPFWHMNGKLTPAGIDSQMHDVKYKSNFGGVTVLPVSQQPGFGSDKMFPGMEPAYLTEEYFTLFRRILDNAKKEGLQVIWYDDLDFPSGSAGGRMKKQYPNDTRKILSKKDSVVTGPKSLKLPIQTARLMAAVAMQTTTKQRIDLVHSINNQTLYWNVPDGEWKIMLFTCDVVNSTMANDIAVDYLDPDAVRRYIEMNHEQFAGRFKEYFGNVIQQIFFDDVGFFTPLEHGERTWTDKFNEKFKALYDKDPALYYPALWEDIGTETQAARVALFNTRAVLLSEGFPKVVREWCDKYGLKSSGHPPGNYEIQPVDMNGDIIKYYKYEHVPLADLIFSYTHGREGFKLISSSANLDDKPVVAAEIYGAIGAFGGAKFNKQTLYRAAMDVFSRGINFLIPHGMWYDPRPESVRIPPLISQYDPEIGPALAQYNEWAARSCMMLQGGQTVSEIAVIYPIASLEAWFHFQAKPTKGFMDWGKFVSPGTDYLAVGDMLTNEVHRDFTFLHPESLVDKCVVADKQLVLNNAVNKQTFKVVIIPGGKVISVRALEKIKEFYDNGGSVIATSILPSQSAEFDQNEKVVALVKEIFGIDTSKELPAISPDLKTNSKQGKALFIPKPTSEAIGAALEKMGISADVRFENNPHPTSGQGVFNYIHKNKDKKAIYFFSNSSDDEVITTVSVRGKRKLSLWNPHNGTISAIPGAKTASIEKETYTQFPLKLKGISSVFVVGE